jgi:hypothetical protein
MHARHLLRSTKNRTRRKPLYSRCIRRVGKICALRCAIAPRNASRAPYALFKTQHVVSMHKRRRSINRKHWFFCRAVVIRMQCSRSPRTLLRLRHSLRLGGQHGEEAKDEDEVSGEKGRKEDQAPEEEVTRAASQSSTSNDVDDCVTRAGASRGAVSASRSHFDTAGTDRRQRASARQGFELHWSISVVTRVFDALGPAGKVKKRDGRFPDLAVAEVSALGIGPRPLTDALGVSGRRASASGRIGPGGQPC